MTAVRTGALAAGTALALLLGIAVGASSIEEEDDGVPGGEVGAYGLDPSKIPAAYRQWVIRAGETCSAAPAALIAAQIEAESNWNPKARSPVGALGLSQFMPGTWATWGTDGDGDGKADPFSPPDAIMSQARYDCYLAGQVSGLAGDPTKLMLAAYNAGPGAVQEYGGIPPYPETQQYVVRITGLMAKYAAEEPPDEEGGTFGRRIVAYARKQLGVPYSWGGGSVYGPTTGIAHGSKTVGYDCSALTQYAVYHASGRKLMLPRSSQQQATQGREVKRPQVGDLIAFQLNSASYDHIAIYIGGGEILHAPRTGKDVMIEPLSGYYTGKKHTIRRLG